MSHPISTGPMYIGGMLIVMSALIFYTHGVKNPERPRPFTLKQYVWGCGLIFACGIFLVIFPFVFPQ